MAQTNILLEAGTNELEIVEFYLDEPAVEGSHYQGYYGVNVAKVLEIIRMPQVTEMPEVSHPCVLGAFNQRSHIIPLVDLSMWLGKKRVEKEPPKVIVTEFNKVTTAFLVSGVTRIHRISWEEVEPPNRFVSTLSGDSITGVVKMEDRIIFILDLEKIVADLNPSLGLRLDESIVWEKSENYKALVADDSTLVREMLKDLLQKAGFIVETVHNGKQAWDRLEQLRNLATQNGKPIWDYVNVLVSDIEMPSMDGHNLTLRVKQDPVLRKLPVMLFSSLITDKLRHKGDSVGADEQISKPEVSRLALRAKDLIAKYMEESE
ncbi:two-component system chemotaxis response regulator CheV [Desulfobaculum xiamenense]|uniref:Two-component system chemotaxis response regulator CheV n=1 Tax=Desulfobaculum xiamenense TaxID=995050 RepID=A0A846QFF0_9BACT|nr:chemotaxis protein [Desulfobaculum xiamenense]NJB67058.1 two-component system chemotaxis response regulator CheV [Desulfobaculum xiamenense]